MKKLTAILAFALLFSFGCSSVSAEEQVSQQETNGGYWWFE